MDHAVSRGLVIAAVAALGLGALPGCDAGKEPFLKAAQAEEKGEFDAAAPLYEEVCAKKSPLCEAAKTRGARMALKRAWKAIEEGRYKDAKGILDGAATSADSRTAEEAAAALALPEVVQGLAFEAALAASDKAETMRAMEAVAREPSALAPKAKEWLDKNRPGLLLGQVKAACVPAAQASCAALAKRLAELHPESAEAKEAKGLAADNYKRLYPKLKDVENLLIQRISVHDKEKKIEACKALGVSEDDCAQRATTGQVPDLSYLQNFWQKKLVDVDDPFYRKQFEARWEKAASGEYDAEPWPKP